ncbi:MAG: type 4a pilus biogenesis protein PilO [Deltaproteobacteria bacterium]|nr:type 4a pilus biogenesis protein PilO [Deltaproteobacteria bacterium]
MAKPGQTLAKTTTTQKTAALVIFMLLIGIGYWAVIYRGVSKDAEDARSQTSNLQRQEHEWTTKQSTYRADIEELNRAKARVHDQVKILPMRADMDAFLDNLNSIAQLTGLQIQSTLPETEEPQEGFYARLPVKLEMRGRYFQVAKFLFNIGRVERIINMENIELAEPTVVDNDVMLKAKVLATTFRALSEEEMAAAAGAAPGASGAQPGG